MTKKHSDAETSKIEEQLKELKKAKTEEALQESDNKYQLLLESSDDPIYLVDKELKYLYANQKLLSRYGKSLSKVIGQSYANFHSPEATKLFSDRIKKVLKSGKPVVYEYKSQRDKKDFLRTLSPVINPNTKEITAITVISKDITKQKQSEERIKHLNRVLLAVRNVNQLITRENDRVSLIEKACSLLVETRGYLDVWIATLDEKGKITKYANAGDSEYILKISEILKSGKIPPCGIEALKRSKIKITKQGQSICSGCSVLNYDIGKGVVTIPLKYENKIYGIAAATVPAELVTDEEEQSLFTEVTGDIAFALWKIEMEEKQQKLKEIESSILHSVPFAVIGLHERQITFTNESVKDVFGWEAAELIGKKTRILYRSDEEYEKIADLFYPVLEQQQTHSEEFPCRRKDGKDIICMVSAARIGESLKDREIVVTYADITEHKRAEEELKESEESYRGLFNSTTDAIYVQDKAGFFLDVNDGAVKMYGYPRGFFIGKTPEFLSAPGKNDMKKVLKMVQKAFMGEPQRFEFYGLRKNGEVFPKDVQLNSGAYFGEKVVIAFARDITERKHAEEALRDSEKNFRSIFHFVPESLLAVNNKIEVLNSNKAFEKLISRYAPELNMSEKELRKKIISELRKHFGKTKHGFIKISGGEK